MPVTLAFDIYGTLIDTHGVTAMLRTLVGDAAPAFSQYWRDKQLEYTFRRGLMQHYQPFPVCTRQALDYTCRHFQADIPAGDRQALMEVYRTLPAFADVSDALQKLQTAGLRLFAFSNGTAAAVNTLLEHAALDNYFRDVVSVDEVKSFKPDPAVYQHFLQRAGSQTENSWLISSNPFDVIGALGAGMNSAWVQRTPQAIFDPWDFQPTLTISSLHELADYFVA
jgi:2-haloacid dehalogenase